jgi:type I restriction enzyme S subunit
MLLATKFRFTPRHVLYGKLRPYLNKTTLPDFDGVCTTEILPLLPKPQTLDRGYLYGALLSQRFVKWATNSVSGANLPRLDPERLLEYEIELPNLSEQQRIAGQLEQVDRLRRTRRYALELTDTFLPAAFLKLFEDLRSNPRDYELRALGDICDVRDGTHDSPKFHQEGIPLVTSKNLVSGAVDLSKVDLISEEDYEKINKRSKVHLGDILMPMIGTIGNPVLVEEPPRFAIKNVALIKSIAGSPSFAYIRELLRGRYFDYLTSMNSRGGTQQFVALSDIRGFCIPVPPVPLQQEFAALVQRVERLRAVQREALRQAEHLFQTLLHQAFSESA